MTLKNSNVYKKLRKGLILNALGLLISELIVIHPIIWIIFELNFNWVFVLTTVVCSTLGTIGAHEALNGIKEYGGRIDSMKSTYYAALDHGIASETVLAAMEYIDIHANELENELYRLEFDDAGGFVIISDETGETIYTGRPYENK